MEENEAADLWMDLMPSQCIPFWPETDSMKLHCKLRGSNVISQHFPITTNHSTVLRMDKGVCWILNNNLFTIVQNHKYLSLFFY